jgi:hypothetical protein
MPFDWNDFFALAEKLAVSADEASKRTAISRAYYSVFNLAFARAEATAGAFPGDESTHNWCWGKYIGTIDPDCRRLGFDGQRMKRGRVKADYKSAEIPRLSDEVKWMLQEAREFRAALLVLNPRYPRP